jgi:molybdopterin-guanine dinucleotide biosynthesis protein A
MQQAGNVQLLLTVEQDAQLPDVVKENIAGWQQLPVLSISDLDGIAAFLRLELQKNMAPLKGLVLAGGRSSRMGFDKSSLSWHGKEQRIYMADLLRQYCEEVFISCLPGQLNTVNEGYKIIEDSFTGLGPYGAILSAFREYPDAAWLVVACDLPMLNDSTLSFLTQNRNSSRMATTFQSPAGGFPEPLITIWEPASYPVLLSLLSQGYSCPRKALESNPINMLQVPDKDALTNVNTPAEKERVDSMLKSRGQQAFPL